MIFDSHAHLISPDRERYPPDPLSGAVNPADFEDPMTTERLLAEMDAFGIARAAAVHRNSVYGFDNSLVCDAAAAHPDRLAAVCSIDCLADDCGDQVRHWVGGRGAAGVRVMEPFRGSDPRAAAVTWTVGDPAWFTNRAMWVAAADLDTPVCVHFFRWNREAGLPALAKVLEEFRGVTVVLDHFTNMAVESGPPDHGVDDLVKRIAEFPKVAMKFTTLPLGGLDEKGIDAAPIVKRVVGLFGPERVMWGSDVSQSKGAYDYMVELGRKACALLTDDEREAVLYGAADRVYGRAFKAAP
jgi:L-fuconolactonase